MLTVPMRHHAQRDGPANSPAKTLLGRALQRLGRDAFGTRQASADRAAVDAMFADFDAILTAPAPGEAPLGLETTGKATFNLLWTGSVTAVVSAAGATMPMAHMEFKAIEPVLGTSTGGLSVGSGRYYQFYGVAFQQMQFTENADGDTLQMTCIALGMSGANTSGYLS